MKILIPKVDQSSEAIVPSYEEILIDQIEVLEASIGLDTICKEYDAMITTKNNINEVITVIKTHGIDEGFISLLDNELQTVAPSFSDKDVDNTVSELVVASEGLVRGIGKMIKNIWHFIVRLWKGFVRLVKKIFGRDEKKLFVDVTNTAKQTSKKVGNDVTVADIIDEAAKPGSTTIIKETADDTDKKASSTNNNTAPIDYREDLINKLVDMNITTAEADMDNLGIEASVLVVIQSVITELSTGTWAVDGEMGDGKGAASLGQAGNLKRLETAANKLPTVTTISKQEVIEKFVKPIIELSSIDAVNELRSQNEVLLAEVNKSIVLSKAIEKIKIEDITIGEDEDPEFPLVKVLRLVSAISSMYTAKVLKQKAILQKQLIAIHAACKVILSK